MTSRSSCPEGIVLVDQSGLPYRTYHSNNSRRRSILCCCCPSPRQRHRSDDGDGPSQDDTRCCGCWKFARACLLSPLGVCVLILAYTSLGAFVFMTIEGTAAQERRRLSVAPLSSRSLEVGLAKNETIQKMWEITEKLNVLYEDKWTAAIADEMDRFQRLVMDAVRNRSFNRVDNYDRVQWTFSGSFLYSLTVITTIGFGDTTPETTLGKTVTILYALVGIPLMLLYLSNIGDVLARGLKRLYRFFCCCANKDPSSASAAASGSPAMASSGTQHGIANKDYGTSSRPTSTVGATDLTAGLVIKADTDVTAGGPLYMTNHVGPGGVPTGGLLMAPDLQIQQSQQLMPAGDFPGGIPQNQAIQHQRSIFATEHSRGGPDPYFNDAPEDHELIEYRNQSANNIRTMQPGNSGKTYLPPGQRPVIPIILCLGLMIAYVSGGAVLLAWWEERWSYFDGAYFCFVALSTIGFGNLNPGKGIGERFASQPELVQASFLFCSLYLLVGMALIAMCFNLLQEHLLVASHVSSSPSGAINANATHQPCAIHHRPETTALTYNGPQTTELITPQGNYYQQLSVQADSTGTGPTATINR